MDLPQGDIAGRYKILSCLGRGSGGNVYLVSDAIRGGRRLALKAARIPKAGPSSWLTDLRDEFATLSLLRHPNLAQVHDFGSTDTEMFFTSEWVAGRDILAATDGLDFNLVFSLLVQMLQAVDFIHRRGILHLDLKPANILVQDSEGSGEATAKLIDFGISQWTKIGRHQEAGYIGTPPFAAPELIGGQAGTRASDIYSLGMIFHLILCRRFPFASQNPFEILAEQGRVEPQTMGRIHPALPLEFSDLLGRMVARDPKDRFGSTAAVLEAINQCLGENFSMRGETAPIHILEENEIHFHPDLIEHLVRAMSDAKPRGVALIGTKGSGKTRILQRVKALLQLHGRRAYLFSSLEELRIFFETSPGLEAPLLLDFDEPSFLGTPAWQSRMHGRRMVLASVVPPPADFSFDATLAVPPLAFGALSDFIQEEIRQAPFDLAKRVQEYLNPGTPDRLESLLQAFRDLKLLAWSESGWHWQGEAPDLADVEGRYLEIWQSRKNKVREILASSGLGLPAAVLEGMIGVDPGFLEDRLASWIQEDWLDAGWQEGCRRYFCVAPSAASESPAGLARDPDWLRDQFQSLYDAGKFGLGVAWARALKSEGCQAVPPQVAVHAARHWVAEGDAAQALAWLPVPEPEGFAERGLFHEIRARALHLQGHREKAGRALSKAETSYRKAENLSGLARISNLRGSFAKQEAGFSVAENCYAAAVELARQAKDRYCEGSARVNLALTYQDQGKIDEAHLAYRRAWAISRRCSHPMLSQTLYHNWINLLHHMGRSREAEKLCYEWLQQAVQHQYPEQQASALNYLALFAGQRKHYELQGAYLDQAIGLLNSRKSPRLFAQFLINRSLLRWSLGKYFSAQRDAEAALKIHRHFPEDPLMGYAHLVLGKVFRDRELCDYSEAGRCLLRARANVLKNQNRPLLWEVEYNLGLLEKMKGDREAARKYFLFARRALEDLEQALPEALKESYQRDRKSERLARELEAQ